MGPNLMTPTPIHSPSKSSKNTFDDLDDLFESIRELDVGSTITNRRYKNTLTLICSGEGCKLYVDYSDGNWVPCETGNSNSIQTDDIVDPFGDALSDTNPFD